MWSVFTLMLNDYYFCEIVHFIISINTMSCDFIYHVFQSTYQRKHKKKQIFLYLCIAHYCRNVYTVNFEQGQGQLCSLEWFWNQKPRKWILLQVILYIIHFQNWWNKETLRFATSPRSFTCLLPYCFNLTYLPALLI